MSKDIKPTKNERIEKLENEVEALWTFVTTLNARVSAVELQRLNVPYAPPVPEKKVYDTDQERPFLIAGKLRRRER